MRTHLVALAVALATSALVAQSPCTRAVAGLNDTDRLGWSVAVLGDVNGDGVADYAAGAPACGSLALGSGCKGPGQVYVVSGKNGAVLFRVGGVAQGDMFGMSIAGFADRNGDGLPDSNGDIDGDARADFVVSAPREKFGTIAKAGAVYIVLSKNYPSPAGMKGQLVSITKLTSRKVNGLKKERYLGWSVGTIGDVDGDKKPDVLIGEPGAPGPKSGGGTYRNAGRVLVVSSASGKRLWDVFGTAVGQKMGEAVAGIGDINGDSIPDLAVGSPNKSRADIYSGRLSNGTPLRLWTQTGTLNGGFGHRVCGLGDMNGDGRAEWAVTDPGPTGVRGSADVYSLKGNSPARLQRVYGKGPFGNFGSALAAAGDFDGDRVPDFMVGDRFAHPLGNRTAVSNAGEVILFSGRTGKQLYQLIGDPQDRFGSAACCVGDVNGDKQLDYVAGASRKKQGSVGRHHGQVKLFQGLRGPARYGVGCAAGNGTVPTTTEGGDGPCIATPNFRVSLADAAPQGTAFLAAGMTTSNVNVFGCRLLVGQIVGITQVPISVTGHAWIAAPIPNIPAIRGFVARSQWFVYSAGRWSASRGLATTLR